MKKLIALGLSLWMSATLASTAQAANMCSGTGHVPMDHGVPWPWGREIHIALKDVQGVWGTTTNQCSNWFFFNVQNDNNGGKIVVIEQYDPDACVVISKGVGYQNDRYIYAQMVNQTTGKSYNLTVHAFNSSDVVTSAYSHQASSGGKGFDKSADTSVMMALSLFPIGQSDDRSAYEIERIQLANAPVCRQ